MGRDQRSMGTSSITAAHHGTGEQLCGQMCGSDKDACCLRAAGKLPHTVCVVHNAHTAAVAAVEGPDCRRL